MHDLDTLLAYALAKPGAFEDRPFGPETLVLKVAGKMFGAVGLDASPLQIALKCDPLQAEQLREAFAAIGLPSYLDKRHWIAVTLDGSVPDETLRALVDQSYSLVVKGLTNAARAQLAAPRPDQGEQR